MKAVVYMQVDDLSNSLLLDKIIELGYVAMHVWVGDTFQVYQVEMTSEDLMVLRLSVPFFQIDGLKGENEN